MVVYFGLSTALRSLGGTGAIFIDWLLWTSFGVIFAIAISFVVVKPIGEKMKQEKWEEIVTDYSKFGKYQIPQILFWAIMEMIIISVWGGLLLLVVALLICVFSKYKGQIEWTKE